MASSSPAASGVEGQSLVPFVLVFQGRTGSSYLTSALRSHPDVHAVGEEMVELVRGNKLAEIRQFLTGEQARRHRAAGFKAKLEDIADPPAFAAMLRDIDARLIYLARRNRIKHVVSFFTGERLHNATGHWNVYQGVAINEEPIRIGIEEFERRLRTIEQEVTDLAAFVLSAERPTLFLQYEDLLSRSDECLTVVLSFLGLPWRPISGGTLKNTSDNLSRVLSNFDELRSHYAGTPYAAMFDEGVEA